MDSTNQKQHTRYKLRKLAYYVEYCQRNLNRLYSSSQLEPLSGPGWFIKDQIALYKRFMYRAYNLYMWLKYGKKNRGASSGFFFGACFFNVAELYFFLAFFFQAKKVRSTPLFLIIAGWFFGITIVAKSGRYASFLL